MNQTEQKLLRIANLAGPVATAIPQGKLVFKIVALDLAYLNEYDLLGEEDQGENLQTTFYEGTTLTYHDKLTILKAFVYFSQLHGVDYTHEFDRSMVSEFDKWLNYFLKAYEEWCKYHNPILKRQQFQIEITSRDLFHHIWVGRMGDFILTGTFLGEQTQAIGYATLRMKALNAHLFETLPHTL